ncbi:lipid phosphate phosphatase 1 [Peniophora sp. CONT]|nr:lipid phosphate phosphatase 1 [Peniophora sp. CONT]
MAGWLESAKSRAHAFAGRDALDWLDKAYILDWAVAIALHFVAKWIDTMPVFERVWSLTDPLISFPHANPERVTGHLNDAISIWVSIGVFVVFGAVRRSLFEIHQGVLTAFAARALNDAVTDLMKNRVGRLRPDFLARCAWDLIKQECTGEPRVVKDGHRSFPSGHSSTAFVGMTLVALVLASKTGSVCGSAPTRIGSRYSRLVLTLLPFVWSAYVAISRVEDYRHHKEDVLAGSTIGILCAVAVYHIFWPSPFSRGSFAPDTYGVPRRASQNEYHEQYEVANHDLDAV